MLGAWVNWATTSVCFSTRQGNSAMARVYIGAGVSWIKKTGKIQNKKGGQSPPFFVHLIN